MARTSSTLHEDNTGTGTGALADVSGTHHTFQVDVVKAGAFTVVVNPKWAASRDNAQASIAGSQTITGTDTASAVFTRTGSASVVSCPIETNAAAASVTITHTGA